MRSVLFASAAVVVALATGISAQKTTQLKVGGGGSPHVRSEWTVDGATITIEYGRPYLKGRPESQMMPAGKPWRAGADEASILTTDKPVTFGKVKLQPGTYTLNAEPGAGEWQLLIGKLEKPGQWGIPYKSDLEIGRVPMKVGKTSAPVEQVTFAIDDTPAGGTLKIEWGTTSASVPFTVG